MTTFVPLGERDVLVFAHIHKTAGTTLGTLLRRRYGKGLFVHHDVAQPHRRLEALAARIRAGRPPRAIITHLGYGFHERLPGDLRYIYISLLRDPVDRTLSAYYALLQAGRLKEGTPLVEFCTSDELAVFPRRMWNHQVTCLSGLRVEALLDGRTLRPEDFDDELLERAKANLDTFAAVGLVSRFEESLLLLGRTFGWPLHTLRSVPKNVGKRRPKRVALSDEEREVLENVNALDFALYRHAERRFEALLTERVPDLDERLRSLSRLNRVYRSVAPAVERLGTLRRYARRAVRAR